MSEKENSAKGSIASFYSKERIRLVSYVRRLIDDSGDRDGEDIVQDVALAILSRPDFLLPIEALSAYVYNAVRNRVVDHFRRSVPTVSLDEELNGDSGSTTLGDLVASRDDVESEVARLELKKRLTDAINELPEDQRKIVIETEFNGRRFTDLSKEWGIPLGTLLARKSRAMARVRKSLDEYAER